MIAVTDFFLLPFDQTHKNDVWISLMYKYENLIKLGLI